MLKLIKIWKKIEFKIRTFNLQIKIVEYKNRGSAFANY